MRAAVLKAESDFLMSSDPDDTPSVVRAPTRMVAAERSYPPYIQRLISAFRGLEEPSSRSIDRGAKGIDSLVELCVERYQLGKETPEEIIARNWHHIVGERFAGQCAPEKIDASRTLIIRVPGSAARRELAFSEDRIMTAIRSLDGCGRIQGISLRAG